MGSALSEAECDQVLGRLDSAYVEVVGYDVAAALARRETVEVAFQPGNGTLYGLVFVPLHPGLPHARPRVVDGNPWPERAVPGIDYFDPGGVLVCWVEHGCYPSRLDGPGALAYPYIMEKFGTGAADALVLQALFDSVGVAAQERRGG